MYNYLSFHRGVTRGVSKKPQKLMPLYVYTIHVRIHPGYNRIYTRHEIYVTPGSHTQYYIICLGYST